MKKWTPVVVLFALWLAACTDLLPDEDRLVGCWEMDLGSHKAYFSFGSQSDGGDVLYYVDNFSVTDLGAWAIEDGLLSIIWSEEFGVDFAYEFVDANTLHLVRDSGTARVLLLTRV
jgi:hypothetical protein